MSFEVAVARPLAGRVVLVTRAREQAAAFAALLEEAGGTVMLVPTIAIEPPDSWEPLDAALARAAQYRWAVFTSVNGVEMVRRHLAQSGRGSDVLASCRIAAIGPATAEALRGWGLRVAAVPEEYVAESLVDRLRSEIAPGDRVLMAGVTVASIGPITRATAAGFGLDTHVMPIEYTIPALARAIAAYFAEGRS
jgi:uroporphyrinogen III methyltransferase / synthase